MRFWKIYSGIPGHLLHIKNGIIFVVRKVNQEENIKGIRTTHPHQKEDLKKFYVKNIELKITIFLSFQDSIQVRKLM